MVPNLLYLVVSFLLQFDQKLPVQLPLFFQSLVEVDAALDGLDLVVDVSGDLAQLHVQVLNLLVVRGVVLASFRESVFLGIFELHHACLNSSNLLC